MDGSKVIVFGSFTEDELTPLQRKPSENNELPVKKKEFLFGSLPLVSGALLTGGNGKSSKKLASSVKSGNSVKKGDGLVHSKDLLPGSAAFPKEKGNIQGSNHFSPLSNGLKEIKDDAVDLASLCLSKSDETVLSQPSASPPQVDSKKINQNGVHDESQMILPSKDDLKKASNGTFILLSLCSALAGIENSRHS